MKKGRCSHKLQPILRSPTVLERPPAANILWRWQRTGCGEEGGGDSAKYLASVPRLKVNFTQPPQSCKTRTPPLLIDTAPLPPSPYRSFTVHRERRKNKREEREVKHHGFVREVLAKATVRCEICKLLILRGMCCPLSAPQRKCDLLINNHAYYIYD